MPTELWTAMQAARPASSYSYGTYRTVAPSVTLRRIKPLLWSAGITRLADLTGLDYLGIPVYQAVRPKSRNLSVAQGKGITRTHAKVSALMESLEFFHAEEVPGPRRTAAMGTVRKELGYDPAALLRPSWGELPDHLEVTWVTATDLTTGEPTWLPVQLCEMNATVTERIAKINFLSASNGLASGNTPLEAVLHALHELIERDAVTLSEEHRFDAASALRLDSVGSALCRGLIERLRSVGRLHVHVPRAPTGRACFEAFFEADDIPHMTFFGAGCHPRRQIALIRALTEAAQSRLTFIAGSRDDLDVRHYPKHGSTAAAEMPAAVGPRWPDRPAVDFGEVPDIRPSDPATDLATLAGLVRDQTGAAPMAVDLTRPEFGLPVVYVVAPGLRVNHYGH